MIDSFDVFVKELGKTRGRMRWLVTEETGGLRGYCDKRYYCPITAVCLNMTGKRYDTVEYEYAASEVDMNHDLVELVTRSSDIPDYNLEIRGKIKEVIGIR